MKGFNWLLNLLPFNGSKTKVGLLLTVVSFLYGILKAIDPADIDLIVNAVQNAPATAAGVIGVITLVVGIIHKYVKAAVAKQQNQVVEEGVK